MYRLINTAILVYTALVVEREHLTLEFLDI